MALRLGDAAPNFTADTTQGPIELYDWKGDSWAVLFSHPKDFTPVCTTELGYMAKIKPEFDRRGVKIIGLSVDPTGDHERVRAGKLRAGLGRAASERLLVEADHRVRDLEHRAADASDLGRLR